MGNTSSKTNDTTNLFEKGGVHALDVIAAKFILTENFKDLSRLTNSDYCNNLLILTADTIKKLMNQRQIEYFYNNKINSEKVLFLTQNKSSSKDDPYKEMPPTSSSDLPPAPPMVNPEEALNTEAEKKGEELKITDQKGGNSYDIQNREKKQAMCLGIAKYYVTIAHIFSAISLIVNPKYIWSDPRTGEKHEYSLKQRNKIPENAKIKINTTENFCDRRIKALQGKYKDPDKSDLISLNLSNICSMNQKTHTKTSADEGTPEEWGNTVYTQKTLSEEMGFDKLEKLYYDKYNLKTGRFDSMKEGGKGKTDFLKDLKMFYNTFTEKPRKSFNKWYNAGTKKGPVKRGFADVILEDYGDSPKCGADGSYKTPLNLNSENQSEVNLFEKYAKHIKFMEETTKIQKDKIISILGEIFKASQSQDGKSTVVINPALTSSVLQQIVIKARKAIFELYMKCETDFKKALDLFEGIVVNRQIKKIKNEEIALKEEEEKLEKKIPQSEDIDDDDENSLDKIEDGIVGNLEQEAKPEQPQQATQETKEVAPEQPPQATQETKEVAPEQPPQATQETKEVAPPQAEVKQ
jgi:hypothetical protein